MTTSAALEYPSSSEFNVLVQRFKLLNLVQRVAHRDVSEMLDTVGLEGLSRKGTLSRWAWDDKDDAGVALGDDSGPMHGMGGGMHLLGSTRPARGGWRRGAGGADAAARRSEQARPLPSSRGAGPLTVAAARPRSPPRMQFGRPTSSFEARVTAARWNSGVEADTDPSSVERAYAGTTATLRHTPPPPPTGPSPAASDTRRRYVVRRTHRVVRRSPEERDNFFARLAEPRVRPGAASEEVLVYDDAAEGRSASAPPPTTRPREGQDAVAAYDDPHSRGVLPGARAAYAHEGYAAPPFPPPAPFPATSTAPLHTPPPQQQQRRPSLDAYYAYPRQPAPLPLSPQQQQQHQLRQRLSASLFSPTPAASWAADPSGASRSASGGVGGAQEYPYAAVEEDGAGEGARLSPPPPPRAGTVAAAAPATAAPGGLVRRRSVNFATPEGGDETGERPLDVRQEALPAQATPAPGDDLNSSPLSQGEVPFFAATAPTMTLPRTENAGTPNAASAARGRGAGSAARGAPSVPHLHLPVRRGSSSGGPDAFEPEDAVASSQRASPGHSHSLSSQPLVKSPRVGRGLAPKAKPKAALESPRVPLEAVRHAAALVSRSGSIPQNFASPNSGGSAQHSYIGPGASPLQFSPLQHQPPQKSPQQQQQRPSSARTPPVTPSFGGAGILRSPRPHTVTVTAGGVAAAAAAAQESAEGESGPRGPTPTPRSRSGAGTTTDSGRRADAAASPLWGARVNATAKQSFEALSSAIDHMLQDHQQLLRQVYKDTATSDKAAPGAAAARKGAAVVRSASASSRRARGRAGDSSYGSSSFEDASDTARTPAARGDGVHHTIEGDLGSADDDDGDELGGGVDVLGASERETDNDVEDEMLLYTRLQHQLTRLDADMVRLGVESGSESSASAHSGGANAAAVASGGVASAATRAPLRTAAAAVPPPRQRSRGEIAEEVVQRLCAYRMDHFQYIAYNERLWNTSSTSQFTFAQRLTAAMTEECWAEVMAEVGSIMDEYVDGLAEHELQ